MTPVFESHVPPVESALGLATCRYQGVPRVVDKHLGAVTLGLYHRGRMVYDDTRGYKVYEVTPRGEYRPDLVAWDVYGNSQYWWMIMEANGLADLSQLRTGMTLRIPPYDGVLTRINQDLQMGGDPFV